MELQKRLFGTLAAAVANWSMGHPKKALKASDFFRLSQEQERRPNARSSPKQVAQAVRDWVEANRNIGNVIDTNPPNEKS